MKRLFFVLLFLVLPLGSLLGHLILEIVYSDNSEYKVETYTCSSLFRDTFGITKVYEERTNKLLCKIKRYFSSRDLFLSNDGKSILFLNFINDSVFHYRNGICDKVYSFEEITNCDHRYEYCYLRYWNYDLRVPKDTFDLNYSSSYFRYRGLIDSTITEQRVFLYKADADSNLVFAEKHSVFSHNDTLYIISPKLKVLALSIKTGLYDQYDFYGIVDYLKTIAKFKKIKKEKFNYKYISFPKLRDGRELREALSDKFEYFFLNENEMFEAMLADSLAHYYFVLKGYLNLNGEFNIIGLEGNSVINKEELTKFIENLEFEELNMPDMVEEWYFQDYIKYRDRDFDVARAEKKRRDTIISIFREKNKLETLSDTISGVYIPVDLDDCHKQLDKILLPRQKREIDETKSAFGMNYYHHGWGTWIRNNWGLWRDSRLSKYFKEKGIDHPDDMSGIILNSYYCYRHNIEFNLEKEVDFYKKYWKEMEKIFEEK